MNSEIFSLEITHPDLEITKAAKYPDGRPMFAVKNRQPVSA
jgi:hypothetical protein